MNKPTREEAELLKELEDHQLPSRRPELELEFHQWAKNTGARVDVFNMIGWLEEKGLLLSESKRQILVDMRNEFKRQGWTQTAANLDKVLKS